MTTRRQFLAGAAAAAITPSLPAQPGTVFADQWGTSFVILTGGSTNVAMAAQLAAAMRQTKEFVAARALASVPT